REGEDADNPRRPPEPMRGAAEGLGAVGRDGAVLLGPHLFDRPYPHPGPAFGVMLRGPPVALAAARFEALWGRAHDLERPIVAALADALRKVPAAAGGAS